MGICLQQHTQIKISIKCVELNCKFMMISIGLPHWPKLITHTHTHTDTHILSFHNQRLKPNLSGFTIFDLELSLIEILQF